MHRDWAPSVKHLAEKNIHVYIDDSDALKALLLFSINTNNTEGAFGSRQSRE
jgi:hypothetical protein